MSTKKKAARLVMWMAKYRGKRIATCFGITRTKAEMMGRLQERKYYPTWYPVRVEIREVEP